MMSYFINRIKKLPVKWTPARDRNRQERQGRAFDRIYRMNRIDWVAKGGEVAVEVVID